MKKFIFKSPETDLQKLFPILDTIQKNILYLTYRVDVILKNTNKVIVDKALQSQVDEYFEDTENIPEEDKEPD